VVPVFQGEYKIMFILLIRCLKGLFDCVLIVWQDCSTYQVVPVFQGVCGIVRNMTVYSLFDRIALGVLMVLMWLQRYPHQCLQHSVGGSTMRARTWMETGLLPTRECILIPIPI
jgi:hypothetical protein